MKTSELSDKVQDWQKRATETARQVGEATDRYVRDNTWSSLALAAVFGCVVGFLLAKRRD